MNINSYITRPILIALFVLLTSCASDVLEKDKMDILAVTDAIFMATKNKDVDGIMSHLSRDFILKVDLSKPPVRRNYTSYKKYLGIMLPSLTNYSYHRSNEKFSRIDSNEFTLSFVVVDEFIFKNKPKTQTQKETWHFVRNNNGFFVSEIWIYR